MQFKLLPISIVMTASCLLAGTAAARESLIDLDNARVGGFGGPVFKVSQIKNQETFEIGGMGGATFTTGLHSIMIGGAGYGLVNEPPWSNNTRLDMGYGGLVLGYTYNPEALVHVDTHLLLGAGGISAIDPSAPNNPEELGSFLVAELGAQLEVNITPFMELGLGTSYRMTSDPSIADLSRSDLTKPTVFISLQFGSL